ncbi:S41 family peptidase [Candidatus Halobeggiatoa sp. HSG11]|nr:S41 family peptidase [Candidatus Halobeggiatoa sp. HSG11]
MQLILVVLLFISPIVAAHDLLEEIAEIISNQHIDKPVKQNFSSVIPDAVNNYLQSIDPYSKYLTAAQYNKDNNYVGIGAKIVAIKQGILIIPFYQGPAFMAGIKQPMLLLSVNGTSTTAMPISNILNLFTDKVVLETQNLFDEVPHITTVKRQPYNLPSVQVIENKYIRINKFVARKTAVALKKVIHNNSIIDLRETTGGDLYETLDCLSLFLPAEKLLVKTVDNKGKIRNYYSLPNQHLIKNITLLVGPRTASSAEIFAKALQYYQHATLIGQQTYGKCLSQTYIELSDGSALKLSNLKIFYPDGSFCDGKGLIPDISLDDKEFYKSLDSFPK